jgi:streptogramin lyase
MLDPVSEEWKTYPYPIKDAGAHSVIEGPDGKIWLVLNKGNHIASFDPETEKFSLYPVPDPGKVAIGPRPHTHIFDSQGRLWYTEIAGNRVSRLDPETGEITVFDLPEQPELFEDSFWLWPYGITIDSKDNVYYTKLGGNRVGRIDAVTGEIKEYEMPVPYSGPRRLDVDSRDNLWIPAFTTGKLYRLNPQTGQFKEYQIPSTDSAPYAVYVDKEKDQVWICEAAANRIGIFDIASETFSEILLPSRFGYTRKIDLDKNTGTIWTSYSQMPAENNKVVAIRFTD